MKRSRADEEEKGAKRGKKGKEKVQLIEDAKKEADSILKEADSIRAGAVEEKQQWEAEKAALAGVQHFESVVKLDVGGVRYTTSLTTLRRFPDSMIGCMFSGRHALPKGEDGYFFIDRDGRHFYHILNFLRSPEGYKVSLPVSVPGSLPVPVPVLVLVSVSLCLFLPLPLQQQ
ncbi:BTB/POZ protein [Ochromonadaceae sp. CCMP2298]|nr:BTB/POZ protein [Ochromonadaceae sp. CCMP2298]